MDYEKVIKRNDIDSTSISLSITVEDVQEYAKPMRKLFLNKAVKKDMTELLQWQLNGKLDMNEDAMFECYTNGASLKGITAEQIANVITQCSADFSDITESMMEENDVQIMDVYKILNKHRDEPPHSNHNELLTHKTIEHCFAIGMPDEIMIEFFTQENEINTFLDNNVSIPLLKDYIERNWLDVLNPENSTFDRLYGAGMKADDLIDCMKNKYNILIKAENCKVFLDIGASPEKISDVILGRTTIPTTETIQHLIDAKLPVEDMLDKCKGKYLDQFTDNLKSMGVEPKYSQQSIDNFLTYVKSDFSECLYEHIEAKQGFTDKQKDSILENAFLQQNNEVIDYMVKKGAMIDDEKLLQSLKKLTYDYNLEQYENKATEILHNVAINHGYKLSQVFKNEVELIEKTYDIKLNSLKELTNKLDLNQRLNQKLAPREQVKKTKTLKL